MHFRNHHGDAVILIALDLYHDYEVRIICNLALFLYN